MKFDLNTIWHNLFIICAFISCNQSQKESPVKETTPNNESYWSGGVTYEVFVQSFYDSNGDGIGDINGLITKLDYIADLGVEAIWLMPVHPSPTYHKYDVKDYFEIHPDYGTLKDFKLFVSEAHKRGLKVILDLVLNHTSNEHHWFKESAKGKENPFRNFYIWADMDSIKAIGETKEATGDSDNLYLWNEAKGNDEKYFGFFWKTMPDLNFDEPKVREEVYKIGKYWLTEIGIDGFRLDAARHIYPEERIHDSVAWWKAFKEEMEIVKTDVFLLGEVWGEAKDVAPFLGGLHAIFNFDQCFALQNMLKNEDATEFLDTLFRTHNLYKKTNKHYVDAIFTTNHDQNRILSELENNIDKGKLAASILLTLPGSPFIYYGEELGMLGKKPDEHIREPFLWEPDTKQGQTSWIEVKYNTPDKVPPLSLQIVDEASMYQHYKKLISIRNNNKALKTGKIEAIKASNKSLLAYKRISGTQQLIVLHNTGKKAISFNVNEKVKTLFSTNNIRTYSGKILPYSSFILEIIDD